LSRRADTRGEAIQIVGGREHRATSNVGSTTNPSTAGRPSCAPAAVRRVTFACARGGAYVAR